MPFFEWLEFTAFSRAIGESVRLTAWLSAIHLVGFTLATGSAVLINLRMLEAALPHSPAASVVRSGGRVVLVGIAISVVTGLLLLSPRASYTVINGAFQAKLLLIAAALLFHFLALVRVAKAPQSSRAARRLAGAIGLASWLGLAVAACWFILFE